MSEVEPTAALAKQDAAVFPGVQCLACRYDLRGLNRSGQCPECGTPVSHSMIAVPGALDAARGLNLLGSSFVLVIVYWLLIPVPISVLLRLGGAISLWNAARHSTFAGARAPAAVLLGLTVLESLSLLGVGMMLLLDWSDLIAPQQSSMVALSIVNLATGLAAWMISCIACLPLARLVGAGSFRLGFTLLAAGAAALGVVAVCTLLLLGPRGAASVVLVFWAVTFAVLLGPALTYGMMLELAALVRGLGFPGPSGLYDPLEMRKQSSPMPL
jgi:hypothetical protein